MYGVHEKRDRFERICRLGHSRKSGKADDGRSKSYQSNAEDDVVRPGRLHNEGQDNDERGSNGVRNSAIHNDLKSRDGKGGEGSKNGHVVRYVRHEGDEHDTTDGYRTKMHDVGRKKEMTRGKETVVERKERKVGTNAVDDYEDGKCGSVNIGDGKDEEDEEVTIVEVRMNKDGMSQDKEIMKRMTDMF